MGNLNEKNKNGKICKNCNAYEFKEGEKYCPNCGAKRDSKSFDVNDNGVNVVYGPITPINMATSFIGKIIKSTFNKKNKK